MRESVKAKGRVGLSLSKKLTPLTVGELGSLQCELNKDLHNDVREYIRYRVAKSYGLKMKVPFTLANLAKRQAEINRLRVKLGVPRIRLIQELRLKFKKF